MENWGNFKVLGIFAVRSILFEGFANGRSIAPSTYHTAEPYTSCPLEPIQQSAFVDLLKKLIN
ncbi:MAG: hypothetical protein WBL95_03705 [Microcoleus sp.]